MSFFKDIMDGFASLAEGARSIGEGLVSFVTDDDVDHRVRRYGQDIVGRFYTVEEDEDDYDVDEAEIELILEEINFSYDAEVSERMCASVNSVREAMKAARLEMTDFRSTISV